VDTWFWILGSVIQALIFGSIFRKAGYTGWLGLLMVVPIVNLVTLFWFASATWPLEMGYMGHEKSKADVNWELKMAIRKAATFEKRGHFKEAIQQLEAVVQRAGEGSPNADLARERIGQLRDRVTAGEQ
jgi:hypothetical protein